jgi:hypothetical protein
MKKQTKRQHWKLLNPLTHALTGAAITESKVLDKLRIRELAAIEAMSKGNGTTVEWQELADLMNICEVMGSNGIGAEALPYCQQAQEALTEAARRFEKTGRMGLSGSGLNAIREVYEYHDLQRSSVPRSVYEQMIVKTRNRIRSKSKEVVEIK